MTAVRPRKGQGLTEVLLIVALVAIGTIGLIGVFGNDLRALFGMSSDAVAGEESVANRTGKSNQGSEKKNLKTFGRSAGSQMNPE
jgi:pilus assembly protein Flp/PilA